MFALLDGQFQDLNYDLRIPSPAKCDIHVESMPGFDGAPHI